MLEKRIVKNVNRVSDSHGSMMNCFTKVQLS